MKRTREDILADIKYYTKRAEYRTKEAEYYTKLREEAEQELKEFDEAMSEMHKYPYEAQQEINDLERQLGEAREFKKFVARMIKLNLTHYMSDYEAIMEIDKKLKEQG